MLGARIWLRSLGLCVFLSLHPVAIRAADIVLTLPLGLDVNELNIPTDNGLTTQKRDLGKLLFFDPRLSVDNTISCTSCHRPENAFSDISAVSAGVLGLAGNRNTPTAINRVFSSVQFHDGRASSLESQATQPIVNAVEMGMPNVASVVTKLNNISGYRDLFQSAFGTDVTALGLEQALATFQRTLLSGNSRVDHFQAGNSIALTPSETRGRNVFNGRGRCDACHGGANFSDESFHNLGVGINNAKPDLGREVVTGNPNHRGQFKTPTLREISLTAPYMHDGSILSLADVVDFYDQGGEANPNLANQIQVLGLSVQQKSDLVNFLSALTGEGWQMAAPSSFPADQDDEVEDEGLPIWLLWHITSGS